MGEFVLHAKANANAMSNQQTNLGLHRKLRLELIVLGKHGQNQKFPLNRTNLHLVSCHSSLVNQEKRFSRLKKRPFFDELTREREKLYFA